MIKQLTIIVLMTALMSMTAMAVQTETCTDSDGGIEIYTPGFVVTNKDFLMDDCDGNSGNLKEYYCDGTKKAHDNVKCSDYGAVCVSQSGPDMCACPAGSSFNSQSQMCVDETEEIPEFSTIAAGIAVAGSVAGYLMLRRKN